MTVGKKMYDRAWFVIALVGAISIFGDRFWPSLTSSRISEMLLGAATAAIMIFTLVFDRQSHGANEVTLQSEKSVEQPAPMIDPAIAVANKVKHESFTLIALNEHVSGRAASTRLLIRDMIRESRSSTELSYKDVIKNAAELACDLNGRLDVIVTKSGDVVLTPAKKELEAGEMRDFRLDPEVSKVSGFTSFVSHKPN